MLLHLPYSYLCGTHCFWIRPFCMLKKFRLHGQLRVFACLNYFCPRKWRGCRAESHIHSDSHHEACLNTQPFASLDCAKTAEPLSTFPVPFPVSPTPIAPSLTGKGTVTLFGSVLTCSMPHVHCLSWRLPFPSARQPHGPVVPGVSLNGNVMRVWVPLIGHWVSVFCLFLTFRDWTWLSQYLLRKILPEPTSREPVGSLSPVPIHGFQISSLWQRRWRIGSRAAEVR